MELDAARRLLAETIGRVRRAWVAAIDHLRDENPESVLEARLVAYADPSGLDRAAQAFAAGELGAYHAAGAAHAKWLHAQLVRKKVATFDASNPVAARWAEANRLDKIREVTQDTRDMVRGVLVDGARTGEGPRDLARRIRDGIGLTDYQERAVTSYRRALERQAYEDALGRRLSSGVSDKTIRAAMERGAPLTQKQIDTAVERYRANYIAYRAETIARTEALRIAHQAQQETYRQAIEAGDLRAEQIEQKWVHGHGRGTKGRKGKLGSDRAFHVSMEGQLRGWGDPFVSGLGGRLLYPGDPAAAAEETVNCACVVTVRIRADVRGPSMSETVVDGEDAAAAIEAEVADEAVVEEAPDLPDPLDPLVDAEAEHVAIDEQIEALEAQRRLLPPRR